MPIFKNGEKYLLYVHVPKTGGTFVESFLQENGYEIYWIDGGDASTLLPVLKCSPQHVHAELLSAMLTIDSFDYIFMTVRNPFDRIVSEYYMRMRHLGLTETFGVWLRRIMKEYESNPYVLDNHIRPQVDFLLPGAKTFRLENGFGQAWIERLQADLNVEFEHKTVSYDHLRGQDAASIEMTEEERALIRAFYAADFKAFGYASN
jgi:hypothetical protein